MQQQLLLLLRANPHRGSANAAAWKETTPRPRSRHPRSETRAAGPMAWRCGTRRTPRAAPTAAEGGGGGTTTGRWAIAGSARPRCGRPPGTARATARPSPPLRRRRRAADATAGKCARLAGGPRCARTQKRAPARGGRRGGARGRTVHRPRAPAQAALPLLRLPAAATRRRHRRSAARRPSIQEAKQKSPKSTQYSVLEYHIAILAS
jgi:hypothetical protein